MRVCFDLVCKHIMLFMGVWMCVGVCAGARVCTTYASVGHRPSPKVATTTGFALHAYIGFTRSSVHYVEGLPSGMRCPLENFPTCSTSNIPRPLPLIPSIHVVNVWSELRKIKKYTNFHSIHANTKSSDTNKRILNTYMDIEITKEDIVQTTKIAIEWELWRYVKFPGN